MLVILDTNVLLGALISSRGAPGNIYQAWQARRFELVTSILQLDEIRRASRYPKLKTLLPTYRVGAMLNNLQHAQVLERLPSLPDDINVHDPDDAFLLSMAQVSQADYLITGDRKAGLLQLGNLGRTRIVTPATFCAVMGYGT